MRIHTKDFSRTLLEVKRKEMSLGPSEGACSPQNVSPRNETCFNRGICLEGNVLCSCLYYYDPLRDCEASIYEAYGGEAYLYVTLSFFVSILTIILFIVEILNDYGTRRIFRRNYVFFGKLVALLYGVLLLAGTSLFVRGLQTKSTEYSLFETLLGILALVVFQSIFMVSSVYWFELLETARSLWSKPPNEVVWAKRGVIGMSAFLVLIMLSHIIKITAELPDMIGTIGQIFLIVITGITFTLNFVFILRAKAWFSTFEKQVVSGKKRHDLIIRKTKILFILNFQILITALGALSTYYLPIDLPQNILLSKGMILFHEALGIAVIFLFLENGISTNYGGLSHLLDVQHLSSRSASSRNLSGRKDDTSSTRFDSQTDLGTAKSSSIPTSHQSHQPTPKIPPLTLEGLLNKVPSFSGEGTGSPSIETSSE